MGSEITVQKDQPLHIKASARVNPDYGEMSALYLVVLGDRVKTIVPTENDQMELALDYSLTPSENMWLAVMAIGRARGSPKNLMAHSAPIYVMLDTQKRFWKTAAVPGIDQEETCKFE